MTQFVQVAGEARYYRQKINNEIIASVIWSISGDDAAIENAQNTDTDATVLIRTPVTGDYLVACKIVTTAGQTVIGEARIQVVETIV